jgi:phosphopantetheinyl transferase
MCPRAQYRPAHWLRIIAHWLKVEPQDLEIQRSELGKPYLAHFPSVHFSLSHSETHSAVAIASQPVGIDIEPPARLLNSSAWQRIAEPAERSMLDALPDSERSEAGAWLWLGKEAHAKLHGTGLAKRSRITWPDRFWLGDAVELSDGIGLTRFMRAGSWMVLAQRESQVPLIIDTVPW